MTTQYSLPDSMKVLEGRDLDKDYEDMKLQDHFEWIAGYDKTIKELAFEVFETIGVKDDITLKIAVDHLNEFQESLKTKMDVLVKEVTDKPDVNVFAKTFVTDWAGCCKYQLTRVNDYTIGDGSTLQKVRWTFETTIKFILRCGTHLVKLDDSFEFKKDVSGYLKNVVIQSIIDSLKKIKSELKTLKESSL